MRQRGTSGVAVLGIAFVIAVLAAAAWMVYRPRWEYRVVTFSDSAWGSGNGRQGSPDELGREGWEIVSARRARGDFDLMGYECILRRRVFP